jgi:hypothetical protein
MPTAFDFKKHRRELTLGGVLLALVAVALSMRAPAPTSGSAEGDAVFVTGPPPAVSKALTQLGSLKLVSVMMSRLSVQPARYDPSQRNIFRFGNIPPPPPTPEEKAQIEATRRAAEEARQAAIREEQRRQAEAQAEAEAKAAQPPIDPATGLPVGFVPPPPPKPTPPAITLRYSGFLGSSRNRMAVLYSGEDIVLARVGDTVNKEFKILDIGYDWVKIGYVDPQFTDQWQKLRMGQ